VSVDFGFGVTISQGYAAIGTVGFCGRFFGNTGCCGAGKA
jgi:hypothetical protein